MDFGLSPEQSLLRDSVASHLQSRADTARVRQTLESDAGWDAELYQELGDQGILGVLVPESFGGTAAGLLEAVVVAQELGRAATPVPFHSAAVLAPLILAACASETQQQEWLTRIAAGDRLVATLFDSELDRGPQGDLSGEAAWVENAQHADALLARLDETFVLVDAKHPRVAIEPLANIDDTRRLASVTFDGVPAADQEVLPRPLAAADAQRIRAAVWLALAADSLGASQRGLALAVDYAKSREQFDRVVASFQAVKHMCAEMVAELDPLQSLLWYAAYAWDNREEDAIWLAAQTKAQAAEVGADVASRATQVHGGIGFTWECDMHIFYKRIAYDRQLFDAPEDLRASAAAMQLDVS